MIAELKLTPYELALTNNQLSSRALICRKGEGAIAFASNCSISARET
jgi:hypothetical protein